MQLLDRGGQLATRPAPNATVSPGWANNDLTQSTPPTIGDPDMINAVMGEFLSLLLQTGQTASKASITQILQAILALARFVDTGAANALAIAPASGVALPAPASLPDGTVFWIIPANTATSTTPTLALWGNAPITITDPLGAALPTGSIAAGVPIQVMKAGGGAPVLWLLGTVTTALKRANNLSDLANAGTARTNLGAGAANGLATLDGSGHVPIAQLPAAIQGAVSYQGTWNAATNSPALASGVGTKGYYYKVSTAGTTTLDGLSVWNVGDDVIFDGTTWDKIDGTTDEVVTFNGRYGAVTLLLSDVTTAVGGTTYDAYGAATALRNNLVQVAPVSTFTSGTLGVSASQSATVSFTTPCAGYLDVTGHSNLSGVATSSGPITSTLTFTSQVSTFSEQTLDSVSFRGFSSLIAAGTAVTATLTQTSGTTAPGVASTARVALSFIPSP